MCGITGFYDVKNRLQRSDLQARCRAMAKAITHRGPDQGDIWVDEAYGVALGHRRLSILDLSDAGRQPMVSASGRYVLVYNGEIYNSPALRVELEAKGAAFRGRSDTEVLLAAIELWGLNLALQKINGMFAFALWDQQKKMLHFARDRLGKKPLYIGWAGDSLVFGSELKALRAHADFKAVIQPQALTAYMERACVPAPLCIYDGVWQLPPGHRLSLEVPALQSSDDLGAMVEPYWHTERVVEAARAAPFKGSAAEAADQFESLLMRCTQGRMLSDVPLGAFLSGGIDSSAVVAMMQAGANAPVKTYSIGFHEAGFDEAVYAKRVAAHLGTDHHELYVSQQDALAVIPSLAGMYDEPFADISAIPTNLVAQFARRDVSVALSGDGGDEMLGGYNRHIEAPRLWKKFGWMPEAVRGMLAGGVEAVSVERWDGLLRAVKPQGGSAMHKLAGLLRQSDERGIYDALCSQWQDAPLVSPEAWDDGRSDVAGLEFAEQMMLWDSTGYLPNDILTKVDRASMAHSLEVRAPLLDSRIFDFVWGLPLDYKIRGGTGKWLLREVLKRHVPASLFERPKQGFSVPVGAWLRDELRDWAESLLSVKSLEQHGLLDTPRIRGVWDDHLQGDGRHAEKLWTVLMFQAWYKEWF